MSELLVSLKGLTRDFSTGGGFLKPRRTMRAVDNISLDIPRGTVTGVVGESGCGKSTLGRLVLRLIEPTSGSITFDGKDIAALKSADMRAMRRNMQMVFQDPYSSIDPRYTVQKALMEPFQIQGTNLSKPEAQTRLHELMAMVGLNPSQTGSYPHQLSGGQKQRVGIARALALKPSFLVLDEPTASLDVSIQAQIIGLLEQLQADLGLTYLFISHDLSIVRYFCSRIVVMYLGRIVEVLPNPQMMPQHPYAQALMNSHFEPDPTRRKQVQILKGEIPSPYNLPQGCAFSARCPAATALCHSDRPALVADASGHQIACHHPQG
jgi:oligopeptide/dipeptide ABC transporter ATP-binding protein